MLMNDGTARCRINNSTIAEHSNESSLKMSVPDPLQRVKLLKDASKHDRRVMNGHRRGRTVLYDRSSKLK